MPYSAPQARDLGLYLSVPFCRSKCTYCNFASGVYPASEMERYVARLILDLKNSHNFAAQQGALLPDAVGSIYFGGGTPTLLSAEHITAIFTAIRETFTLTADAEITIECAPGQLSDATLEAMLRSGVNRMSLGVQSFVDAESAASGRLHTRKSVLDEIARLRSAGIGNLNLDLIAGLPHQTRASWSESLDCLLEANLPHASIYMLEVDEDSRLGREMLTGGARYSAGLVPTDSAIAEMYLEAVERLSAAKFLPYEISNFAQPGFESSHNLRYWLRHPYMGLGLDASSMFDCSDGSKLRLTTTSDLKEFAEAADFTAALTETTRVGRSQQLEEAFFLGLRLEQGISLTELRSEFGNAALEPYGPILAQQISERLLEEVQGRLRLTLQGSLLSNELFAAYILNEPAHAI